MGKSVIHDPERAALVRRAFEEYATGRFTKEQLLKQVRVCGLTNWRRRRLTSQAIGMLLRNPLYAGIVNVPRYGVRAKRGDFDALIYGVQPVLSGRVPSATPQQWAHPDVQSARGRHQIFIRRGNAANCFRTGQTITSSGI